LVDEVIWGALASRCRRAAMPVIAATLAGAAFPMAASADPTVTLTTPPAGTTTHYPAGSVPAADFSCSADSVSCKALADSGIPVLSGTALPDTPGVHVVVVTATDAGHLTDTATGTYDVENPPTAAISAPSSGQIYGIGQAVSTTFSCADGTGAPGIGTCKDSGGATSPRGVLDTSSAGDHIYTVTATSQDGQQATSTIHYTVVATPPTVSVTAPVDNGDYFWQALPAAAYTCDHGAGAALQSCTATVGGADVGNGGALPDALGGHTMTVTATDTDGQSVSQAVSYVASLVLAPPISIQSPAEGARYHLDQQVLAQYVCGVSASGPALQSCIGAVPSGHPVDTRTLGKHLFRAAATDVGGQSASETVTYTVIPTTNRFSVSGVAADDQGVARLTVTLPGPGGLAVVAKAWSASGSRTLRRHFAYARVTRTARTAGTLRLSVIPNGRGRALLRAAGAIPVLTLVVTYTPTGAAPRVVRPRPLRLH
jgi:hypothetical protein